MSNRELIIYMALGHNEYIRYRQIVAEQQERERKLIAEQQERKRQEFLAKGKCVGKVLLKSIEPTVDFIQKWDNVDSEHPRLKRGLITTEYVLSVGKIVHDEHIRLKGQ